jgi:hypothetical protein
MSNSKAASSSSNKAASSELSLALSLKKTSLLELVISYLDESGQVSAAKELEKESEISSSSTSSSSSSLRLKVCKAIESRNIPLARTELSLASELINLNPLINFYLTIQHAINLSKEGKQCLAFDTLSTLVPYLSAIPHSHPYRRQFEECCGLLVRKDGEIVDTKKELLLSNKKCHETAALVSCMILKEEVAEGNKGSTVAQLQLETLLKEAILHLSQQDRIKEIETKRLFEEGKDNDSATALTVDEYILQTSVNPGLFLIRSAIKKSFI